MKFVAVSFFFNTAILQKKFLRFDPTLGSNNLGLKKCRIRNHHIFGIARTSAFIWHIWIPLKKFCKRTRRVCVCIVLVHFGRFSQEVNEKSVKLAVFSDTSPTTFTFTPLWNRNEMKRTETIVYRKAQDAEHIICIVFWIINCCEDATH